MGLLRSRRKCWRLYCGVHCRPRLATWVTSYSSYSKECVARCPRRRLLARRRSRVSPKLTGACNRCFSLATRSHRKRLGAGHVWAGVGRLGGNLLKARFALPRKPLALMSLLPYLSASRPKVVERLPSKSSGPVIAWRKLEHCFAHWVELT